MWDNSERLYSAELRTGLHVKSPPTGDRPDKQTAAQSPSRMLVNSKKEQTPDKSKTGINLINCFEQKKAARRSTYNETRS